MKLDSPVYTFCFAAVVCFACSALVCGTSVLLKERQEINKRLDRQEKVLRVAGLIRQGERVSRQEMQKRFEDNITVKLVDLAEGVFAPRDAVSDIESYDQRKARDDPETSIKVPANSAQVSRIPRYALVYNVMKDSRIEQTILPLEGKGLWSTLYAFLALDKDYRTIRGITFYEHGETPGLGGEIENPLWTAKWEGRLAFDESGRTRIQVKRGVANKSPAEDPYNVDGISGATITSQGVSRMMNFWLGGDNKGESGFGPFLRRLQKES